MTSSSEWLSIRVCLVPIMLGRHARRIDDADSLGSLSRHDVSAHRRRGLKRTPVVVGLTLSATAAATLAGHATLTGQTTTKIG